MSVIRKKEPEVELEKKIPEKKIEPIKTPEPEQKIEPVKIPEPEKKIEPIAEKTPEKQLELEVKPPTAKPDIEFKIIKKELKPSEMSFSEWLDSPEF